MAKKLDPIFSEKRPGVAVDLVLFTIKNDQLQVGLIKREEDPYFGKPALPGRFVRYDEPIEKTAQMTLKLKCGVDPDTVLLEQLYTFGQNMHRDTRIRTISIVYFALIQASRIDFQYGSKLLWHDAYRLPKLAFDHAQIITYAIERLRNRVLWDDFAFQLMSEEFTLTQLQRAYEAILGKELDKRNFRKKIAEMHILKDLKKKSMNGVHRPAALYSFIRKK